MMFARPRIKYSRRRKLKRCLKFRSCGTLKHLYCDPNMGTKRWKMDMRKDIPTFATLLVRQEFSFKVRMAANFISSFLIVFCLRERYFACRLHRYHTQGIGCEFEQFWSKMWLRDIRAEQFELTSWESFDELMQDVDLPVIPEIVYPIDDINLWMHLVKSLPVGLCGWSNDELKAWPECCIRDLVKIFAAVMNYGFGLGMMVAKTISFVKKSCPACDAPRQTDYHFELVVQAFWKIHFQR